MVSALLVLLTVAILQVSYAFYTRNILLDAASAGARYGTLYDRTPEEGRERAEQIIRGTYLRVMRKMYIHRYMSIRLEFVFLRFTLPLLCPYWDRGGSQVLFR